MEDVKMSTKSLESVNVRILSRVPVILNCMYCGSSWSPKRAMLGLKMREGWWRCPNGCNSEGPWPKGDVIADDESAEGQRVGTPEP